MQIKWSGTWDESVAKVLPIMHTDVAIEYQDRKAILDCKYYRDALVSRDGRERLHSTHLYQLRIRSKQITCSGWNGVVGILLYPATKHRLDLAFTLLGHRFEIHSLDLDQPWPMIDARLRRILALNVA